MKRTLLVVPALLLAATAQAQFGVKAGINAAVLDGENLGSTSTRYKTYYHGGILYEANVLGPVSIQPELLYSLQGSSIRTAIGNYDAKLHYLNLPVLAKVTVGPVFVEAGPQVGFMVANEKANQVGGGGGYRFKRTDFSLAAGGGLKLGNLLLGARFNAGLNDIDETPYPTNLNDPRFKNRVIQGYVAYQFDND
ncbi:outer membrane beta-barrel protein [Hymenobacter endophyticus]|uniref:Outer membrane beta-barrel protein n=1 Tax=Hymenobacter endophyticus TaxID=3076335 RepID=A0ABU3THA6_9BACT|nr:outer membrane beta-barrel protein [Hymenobacter endophyticus]MDU0370744.1 outer membrane beta-barrel protein [Hymenobacter endophyticus]